MNPKLNGFDVKEVTLYTTDAIKPGMAVMLEENYTAKVPIANSRFIGVCTAVRGDYVSVALTGVVTVPFSGTDISVGYNNLSADGNGYLKLNLSSSYEYLVLEVDEAQKLMTIML